MKIERLDQEILDEAGKPMEDGMTVRKALLIVSRFFDPRKDELNHEDRYRLGMMAVKFQKAQRNVKLSTEEITLLKRRIALVCAPVLVLRLVDILEGNKSAELRAAAEIDEDDAKQSVKDT